MVRCIECRFWKKPSNPHQRPQDPYAGYGDCTLSASRNGLPVHPNTLAFAEDLRSYADLFTSPDYGCIQGQTHQDITEATRP